LFLYYGYLEQKTWIKIVDPANAKKEAEKVATFVAEFNISGLILKNLNYDYTNKVSTSLTTIIIKQYLLLLRLDL